MAINVYTTISNFQGQSIIESNDAYFDLIKDDISKNIV